MLSSSTSPRRQTFEEYWCEHYSGNFFDGPGLGQNSETMDPSPLFFGLNNTEKSVCMSLQAAKYSSWLQESQTTEWKPKMTTSCCNKPCWVNVEEAQLLLWLTLAPLLNVTTIVDYEGFTFTSPSMYIAYKNVAARGIYGCGTLSPSFASLTRGYALSEISTLVSAPNYRHFGPHAPNGPEQVLDPADIFSNCSSIPYDPSSYNTHCYPSLIYPHGMQDVDPAWRSCTTALKGQRMAVPDPPRVLIPVGALGPTTTKETVPLGVMSASPAPILSSPSVTKTHTPVTLASTSRSKHDQQQPSAINTDWPSILNVDTKTERVSAKETPIVAKGGSKPAIGSDTRGPPLDGAHATTNVKLQSLLDSSDGTNVIKVSHVDTTVSESISKKPDSHDPTPMIDSTSPGLDEARGDENPTGHPGALGALASLLLSVFQHPHPHPHPSLRKPEKTSHPSQPLRSTDQELVSLQYIDSLPSESSDKIPLQTITLHLEPSAASFAITDQNGLSLAGTAHPLGPIIIAGSTVKPGATALAIQGHQISIDPKASNLIVDGQTLVLPSMLADTASLSSIAENVAHSDSPKGHGIYIIKGHTLTPGGDKAVTISGTPVAFDANGGDLVIGTSVVEGFYDDEKHSILDHQHPSLLTLGSLTLTIGVADEESDGDRSGDASMSTSAGQQAIIGSQTSRASALTDEEATAAVSMYDILPVTTITETGSTSIYGSKESKARNSTSTSMPNNEIGDSTQESTFSAQSSESATPTSATSAIYVPVQYMYSLILTFALWYLILT